MKQQTAVEWFAERCGLQELKDVIAEAKEMEKEQIIDARLSLDKSDNIWDSAIAFEEAEKYYNETYGEGKE